MTPIWRVDEMGRWLPRSYAADRERRMETMEAERQGLRRVALEEAMLTEKREPIARALYRGEGVTLEMWPALAPLSPAERTRVLGDVRKAFGTPERARP